MLSRLFSLFTKGSRSLPMGVKLIVFVLFLRNFGWGFADPFFSMYLQQFQDSYSFVGFFIAFIQFGALLAIIPLMRLADKMRDITLIQDGEVLYLFVIAFFVTAGLFKSTALLLCALFLAGIAYTFVVVGTESYIRKNDSGGQSTPFGFYVAMDHLGWILGMILGAFFILRTGFNWMFLWVLPGILASFIILPRVHEEGIRSFFKGFHQYLYKPQDFAGIAQDVRSLNPKMAFFLVLAFLDGAIKMFTYIFIPLFALSLNLSLPSIAFLMAVLYMPFIFSFFISELEDHLPRMNVIAVGLFIGAVAYMLLYFIVHEVTIVLLAAVTSFSISIVRPAYNGAITRLTPRRLFGEVTGLTNLADRLGRILGPIATGFVADVYGIQASFLAVAVVAFIFGIVSLFLKGLNGLVTQET